MIGAVLIGTGLWRGAYAVAEQELVGNQAPDQNYRPLLAASRIEGIDLNAETLLLQKQVVSSAAQVHKVSGDLVPLSLTLGVVPAMGLALPASGVSRVLPASLSPSSISKAAASTTLPADPNFSYLSQLQQNLPFVKKIQNYLKTAAGLAASAALLGSALGFPLLLARSNLLQWVAQNAWTWMMGDAAQGKLPQVMTYQTTQGHSFEIYDTYDANTPGGYAFSASNLATLKQNLDNMPPDLLQYVGYIVNGPIPNMLPGDAACTSGDHISIYGVRDVNNEALAHEIAMTLYFNYSSGLFGQEWSALWKQSANNPVWDDVNMYSSYPSRPMPQDQDTPWGAQNDYEDFASVFSNWAGDSGTPRLNPNKSSSALEEAVYRASLGYPVLLEKTLLVAALFTDQATQQLSLYHYSGYAVSATSSPIKTTSTVQASATSLTLGDYTFTIQNGMIVSVSSSATSQQAALNYTFPTPVPIPAFAAARWNLQV